MKCSAKTSRLYYEQFLRMLETHFLCFQHSFYVQIKLTTPSIMNSVPSIFFTQLFRRCILAGGKRRILRLRHGLELYPLSQKMLLMAFFLYAWWQKRRNHAAILSPWSCAFTISHMNFQSVPISKSNKGKLASACHAAENIYNGTHHVDKHIVLRFNSDLAIDDLRILDIREFQYFPRDLRCFLLWNFLWKPIKSSHNSAPFLSWKGIVRSSCNCFCSRLLGVSNYFYHTLFGEKWNIFIENFSH